MVDGKILQKALEMRDEGISYTNISHELGVSIKALYDNIGKEPPYCKNTNYRKGAMKRKMARLSDKERRDLKEMGFVEFGGADDGMAHEKQLSGFVYKGMAHEKQLSEFVNNGVESTDVDMPSFSQKPVVVSARTVKKEDKKDRLLAALMSGKSRKEAADEIGTSLWTVSQYISQDDRFAAFRGRRSRINHIKESVAADSVCDNSFVEQDIKPVSIDNELTEKVIDKLCDRISDQIVQKFINALAEALMEKVK